MNPLAEDYVVFGCGAAFTAPLAFILGSAKGWSNRARHERLTRSMHPRAMAQAKLDELSALIPPASPEGDGSLRSERVAGGAEL